MTIQELISTKSPSEAIAELKSQRITSDEALRAAKKAADIKLHDVNDQAKRPDKRITLYGINPDTPLEQIGGKCYHGVDPDTGERVIIRRDEVKRIAIALQQLIVGRSVAFLFGNPTEYIASSGNELEEALHQEIIKALEKAKAHTLSRQVARDLFTYGEVAELWYWGADGKRLRNTVLSERTNNKLYPYFDDYGDLVAFSRAFSRTHAEGEVRYFETYTAEATYLWADEVLVEGYPKPNPIGRIPIVYAHRGAHETASVDNLISTLEERLSNFSDTNDYHASPKIAVKGGINGFVQKGESGGVIELDTDGSAEYLSWNSAPEAVKMELDTIIKLIYTLTQTPDISFDSVKGLGALSGIGLKMMFMDAHLKVKDNMEVFEPYLQRRANIVKAFIGVAQPHLASAVNSLVINIEQVPYMLTSELDELNYWLSASGQKPLISHEDAVARAGLTGNPQETYKRIKEEEQERQAVLYTEPTNV